MGTPKALLLHQEKTFLELIIQNVVEVGIAKIFVLTGKHDEQIRSELKDTGSWKYLNNPNPERGQLSSIQIGLRHTDDNSSGILLALVDHPLVELNTYKSIINTAIRNPDSIIIPINEDRKGHPVYFGRRFFADLLMAPLDKGARTVVHKYQDQLITVPVQDNGILQDIDRPEDYQNIVLAKNIPT